jgi:hypothetical protein
MYFLSRFKSAARVPHLPRYDAAHKELSGAVFPREVVL